MENELEFIAFCAVFLFLGFILGKWHEINSQTKKDLENLEKESTFNKNNKFLVDDEIKELEVVKEVLS